MPPKRFISFSVLVFLLTHILQPISASGNPPFVGNIETRLLEIREDSNTQPDLLETLLMVSKHWKPSLDLVPLEEKIKKLLHSARQKLSGLDRHEDIIRAIRTTIHEEAGYRYTDQVDEKGVPINPEELFLHGLLDTHKGYCMNLSLLYLILGQKLGIPFYGVALPNHFFVRYEQEAVQINIEPTERGVSYPDSFYWQRFGTSAKTKNPYFMKNLNTRQTLGAYFSNVGMVYYQNQKPERAVFYLGLSTAINPQSIDAQNNLANIYSELKKPQEAIKHYKLALKADPANTSTLFNLGLVLLGSGQATQAFNTFLQITQMDPGFKPAHKMLINMYMLNNRLIPVLLHLKILARIEPMNLQNHLNVAVAYRKLGQHKLAIETLKNVQSQFPDTPEIHEGLADMYFEMEDFQHAIVQYRLVIDQDETRLTSYIQLGWIYYRLHDLPMAEAWTLRGLKKGKEVGQLKAMAQMNLGFYSLLQKKYNPAKEWYEKVILENSAKTIELMIQDIEGVPADYSHRADLQFFKGWIYFKSRQPEKSRHSLQTYLQMETNGPFSEEARSILRALLPTSGKAEKILSLSKISSTEKEENMALIPPGFFIMGSNKSLEDESPEHRVYLDSYWIDKYEVSAEKFAEFLNTMDNAKGYYLDNKFGTLHYDGRFHPRPGLENYPINNITWNAANEYCKWKEKRLPTEAEWEKAARGTSAQTYPWGNGPPSDTLARYFQTWTKEEKHKVMVPVQALTEGQSPYGLHNMAGNVKEWVDDWYDREYYSEQSEYANPRGPIGGEFKAVRGGSWRDMKGFIYSTFRNNGNPSSRMDDYGFRCTKNAAPVSGDKKLTNRVVPPNNG
jgi:formylglycine-generating enzyme required for sulfatase activity/regulator of sirC expression with transglutaminase-like and TPR domain